MMHPCKAVLLTHKNWILSALQQVSRVPVGIVEWVSQREKLREVRGNRSQVRRGGMSESHEQTGHGFLYIHIHSDFWAEVKMQCIGMLLGCPIMNSTCSHTFLANLVLGDVCNTNECGLFSNLFHDDEPLPRNIKLPTIKTYQNHSKPWFNIGPILGHIWRGI